MASLSILSPDGDRGSRSDLLAADVARDLNLDVVIDAVTAPWKDYALADLFLSPLQDVGAVTYRQEVVEDLQDGDLVTAVDVFARDLRNTRSTLEFARQMTNAHSSARAFLAAAEGYAAAVTRLATSLTNANIRSQGMRRFAQYLTDYLASPAFQVLVSEAAAVTERLHALTYAVLVRSNAVTVRQYEGEPDFAAAVEATFERFRQGVVTDYRVKLPPWSDLNHVELQILDRVALLNPDAFAALHAFRAAHADFLDETIVAFEREIHFYISYLAYIAPLQRARLPFCRAQVSSTSREVHAHDAFDIALAAKLLEEKRAVVCNDFELSGRERIFVVSGPNQGGKTTFARMFGQMHHLARLGLPVPGTRACLFLCDRLFTHFERREDMTTLRGKLEDDLVRIRHVLDAASPRSIVILNEIFSSTTLRDALFLTRNVIAAMSDLDLLGVCVTFLDEVASFNEKTVSIVSTVDPHDPATRTYRLERRPADGLAYALAIAEKRAVTYRQLKERFGR